MHSSTIYAFFLSCYMFRYCRHLQGAYTIRTLTLLSALYIRIVVHNLRILFIFYRTVSNLDQERIDGTQELIVTETYTSFKHSNTQIIVSLY